MKICFMGSMDFAVPILEGLNKNHEVLLVVTQPDKPFGRKKILKPTTVKESAIRLGLPVFQPERIKTQNDEILRLDLDMIIVAAYGQIIPESILYHASYQAINVHASLLPKYRGGSPMHRAIQYGDEETGVTIMYMVKKMDAGDIISQRKCRIEEYDNVGLLEEKLAIIGRDLLLETIEKLENDQISPIKQDIEKVTYAWNIKREEEKIDFNSSAKSVYNHVRAFNPWPLTYTTINGQKLKLYDVRYVDENINNNIGEIVRIDQEGVYVQTDDGLILLKEIQLSGKKKMGIKDFMNGVGKKLFNVGNKFE